MRPVPGPVNITVISCDQEPRRKLQEELDEVEETGA